LDEASISFDFSCLNTVKKPFLLDMYKNLKSWPDFHHWINMVYHSIIAFSLIPFAIVFLNIDSGASTLPLISKSLIPVFHILALPILIVPCYLVWRGAKEKLKTISESGEIKVRIISYFGFQTRRFLLLELSAIISLLGMWITLNYLYIIAYLLVLVQFSLLRPSQDKVIRDLAFTKEEREQLRVERF